MVRNTCEKQVETASWAGGSEDLQAHAEMQAQTRLVGTHVLVTG